MNGQNDYFWNASLADLKNGYRYDDSKEAYICLICGELFTDGLIYPKDSELMDAKRAVRTHILERHGSAFDYLLNLDKRCTGLTDTQKELLTYFHQGLSDNEIVQKQGSGSPSTIRNHRFKLREKEKQAKVFLALMQLLEDNKVQKENFDALVAIHNGATMVDDRYVMTQAEKEKIRKNLIIDGKVKALPSKEKKKIVVFQYIMEKFEPGRIYSEKEVNEIIKAIIDDFVTARRYLIEYGYMDRKRDGSEYWVIE